MSSWNGDERHSLGRGSMSQNVTRQGAKRHETQKWVKDGWLLIH